ncbi:PIN domain-containing protein [Anabaena cylindrica UHCC 0172]|uniref:type II toxin-antitoxin system VapC family toxin n=1 Tax=Anabaena cylindrica TaxID=1165 RepID=UPI002B1F7087|nr:PIN domain-containing protein [Anabaena cylindrica]MEA5553546.1 PIN domain-containing protein [Anabaena cylindrica UHCC 0172]
MSEMTLPFIQPPKSRVVLLDTHPLSKVSHPKIDPKVQQWLKSLRDSKIVIRIPEIADYELRRELIREGKKKSLERLDSLSQMFLIPITPETIRKAAELWAWVRNQGKPTASNDSLDGDVILAAQAIIQLKSFDEVIVVTTNVKHISRFASKGIFVADWQQTLDNVV